MTFEELALEYGDLMIHVDSLAFLKKQKNLRVKEKKTENQFIFRHCIGFDCQLVINRMSQDVFFCVYVEKKDLEK